MNMPDPFTEAESTVDRAAFLDRYRHWLYGIIFDAMTVEFLLKDGGDSYRQQRKKLLKDCDKWLQAIYDEIGKPIIDVK